MQEIERHKLIAVIRDSLRRFEEDQYPKLLARLGNETKRSEEQERKVEPEKTKDEQKVKDQQPKIQYVPSRSIRVSFGKAWLADEADVESYLDAMREALLKEIYAGKRIQI
jgi:hypothetical protein